MQHQFIAEILTVVSFQTVLFELKQNKTLVYLLQYSNCRDAGTIKYLDCLCLATQTLLNIHFYNKPLTSTMMSIK